MILIVIVLAAIGIMYAIVGRAFRTEDVALTLGAG
jgi:hypothetical protein